MKKLLFAAILISGFAFAAPSAEAGHYRTVLVGYDRCGHPIYRQVETYSHCEPRYYHQAPTYYRSSSYGRSYDYGRSYRDSRSSSSRPRFAISFGF